MGVANKIWVFTIAMHIICFSSALDELELVNKLMYAFDLLMDHAERHPMMFDADGLYGLVIAEANLDLILTLDLNDLFLQKIKIMNDRLTQLRHIIYKNIQLGKTTGPFEKLLSLLSPSLWMIPNKFMEGYLTPVAPKWKDKYPFKGIPDEYISDMCIGHLLNTVNEDGDCEILNVCEKCYFSNNAGNHGYPLNHRLLFWQVFSVLNCSDYYSVPTMKLDLCSRMHAEAEGLVAGKFYDDVLRDLFLEQVVLCGGEGYTEFFRQDWNELILKWQNHYGCFNIVNDNDKYKGCVSHTTGLAAAFLILNIRFIIISSYYQK